MTDLPPQNPITVDPKKLELAQLMRQLILRPGMRKVELNLDHLGRELIHRGDLIRMGSINNKIETHAILFDHYLVLAKKIKLRQAQGLTSETEKYDVSRLVSAQQRSRGSSDDTSQFQLTYLYSPMTKTMRTS
jgi:hypothetical protein